MHLSVGMPLPADLLFDIQHYRGISPSSSGSTTPEGISSGHRSPALEPITEGKTATNIKKISSTENLKPIIKVSSADNLVKPIIKVSSSDRLNETDLKTESKPNSINESNQCSNKTIIQQKDCNDDGKLSPNIETHTVGCGFRKMGSVPLRKVPKNFNRNRFSNEKFDFSELLKQRSQNTAPEDTRSESKVSLDGLKDPATPSKVTQKYVNNSKIKSDESPKKKTFKEIDTSPDQSIFKRSIFSNTCLNVPKDIPDVISSTFVSKKAQNPDTDKNILTEHRNNTTKSLVTSKSFPIPYKKCHSYEEPAIILNKNVSLQRYGENSERSEDNQESKPSTSSSIVKNIIETLNRRERNRFDFPSRNSYGRSSLKVIGSPKAPICRSGSPEEFTAL